MNPAVLQEWVTRAADARPDARALVHPDGALTYGALERASNRIARALLGSGCERGDRVAFLLPRSPMTIAVIIGILKADCIYVPLDLKSPGVRLATVVRQCDPTVILAGPSSRDPLQALVREGGFEGGALLGWMGREKSSRSVVADDPKEVDLMTRLLESPAFTLGELETLPADRPGWRNGPEDPAYILSTSGSTGTPKGVVITHRNVITFIDWAVRYFTLDATDRIGGYTELTFDLSTFDIHATFAAGAELHMIPEELKLLPPKVLEFMRASGLTHWLSVPSFLEYVVRFDSLAQGDLPTMRWVTWCGDVLPTPALLYWMERLPHASFANLYGPTETTVASSYYEVPWSLDPSAPVPIGRACEGEELLILDSDLRPVPQGEIGDLYIRGAGLSPGYWRDAERTREVFLPDPDPTRKGSGGRIYRTGDLARFDENGNAHFHGREDEQIKTRGFRVELGEVEAALNSLPEIERCAVVGFSSRRSPGKLMGCAYVPPKGNDLPGPRLKERLLDFLPDYMIPVRWKAVDHLPLNDRGKVDRTTVQAWMEEEG